MCQSFAYLSGHSKLGQETMRQIVVAMGFNESHQLTRWPTFRNSL